HFCPVRLRVRRDWGNPAPLFARVGRRAPCRAGQGRPIGPADRQKSGRVRERFPHRDRTETAVSGNTTWDASLAGERTPRRVDRATSGAELFDFVVAQTSPLAIDQTFDRAEARLIRHLAAVAYPITQIKIGHA